MKDQFLIIENFKPGWHKREDDSMIPIGGLRKSVNIQITDRGGLSPRPGETLVGTASDNSSGIISLYSFKKSNGDDILIRSYSDKLEYYNNVVEDWCLIKDGYTADQEFGFKEHMINSDQTDLLYFCNGVEPYSRWTGYESKLSGVLYGGETSIVVDGLLKESVHYDGTANSATTTTIDIANTDWATDVWNDFYVRITDGTKEGYISLITGTTGTQITFDIITGLSGTPTFEIRELAITATGSVVYNGTSIAYTEVPKDDTLTVASAHASFNSVTDDLVGDWRFEDGSGTTLADSSVSADDGTLTNIPVWGSDDEVDGYLTFDSFDDSYVDLGTSTELDGATSFTIAFWIKPTNLAPGAGIFQGVYARGTSGQRCPWIYLDDTTNFLQMQSETIVGGVGDISKSVAVTQDVWQHIVITWDGTNTESYLDSVVYGTKRVSTGHILVNTDGDNYIGKMVGYSSMDGSLSKVRVYKNKVLTQQEITDLYNFKDYVGITEAPVEYNDLPKGNILETAVAQMYVAGVKKAPSTVYRSTLIDATDFGFSSPRSADEGDIVFFPYNGKSISDIKAQEDTLYILKPHAVETLVYTQDAEDLAQVKPILKGNNVGTSSRAWRQDNDIVFATPDNRITSIGRIVSRDTLPQSNDLAYNIRRAVKDYNFDAMDGEENNNRAYMTAKGDKVITKNDRMLVYNKDYRNWEGHWTMTPATVLEYKGNLIYGDAYNSDVYQFIGATNKTRGDDVFPMPVDGRTGWINKNGSGFYLNEISSIAVEGYITSGTTININIYKDFTSTPFKELSIVGTETEYQDGVPLFTVLGGDTVGTEPLGAASIVGDEEADGRRHFIIYLLFEMTQVEYFSIGLESNGLAQDWEITRMGINATDTTFTAQNKIKN